MGAADKMVKGLQAAIVQGQDATQEHVKAIQELLMEIRDNQNRNFVWSMEAIQEICNKLDIKLRDPLEIEPIEKIEELRQ